MKSKSTTIQILLIEDNPGDVRLIREMFNEAGYGMYELTCADRLSDGEICIEKNDFDLILLDLSLPDSQGLDTFIKIHEKSPHIPVVVLTGNTDDILSIKALRAGAQDFLDKGDISGNLLIRSIRYAIERQALLDELEAERQKLRQNEELMLLSRLTGTPQTEATARVFGIGPLRDIMPELFDKMVERYEFVMDKALEKRAYKIDYDISEPLQEMGEELGVLKAQPRDIVEIHTAALQKKYKNSTPQKAKAYSGEATFMLLEIMGYLTAYYRRYAA